MQASAVVDLPADKAVFVFPLITKGREWTLGEVEGDTYRWDVTVDQGVTQYYLEFFANNREGAGLTLGERKTDSPGQWHDWVCWDVSPTVADFIELRERQPEFADS